MAAVQVGSTKHELAAAGYSGDPLKLANSVHSLTVDEGLKALGKRSENEPNSQISVSFVSYLLLQLSKQVGRYLLR